MSKASLQRPSNSKFQTCRQPRPPRSIMQLSWYSWLRDRRDAIALSSRLLGVPQGFDRTIGFHQLTEYIFTFIYRHRLAGSPPNLVTPHESSTSVSASRKHPLIMLWHWTPMHSSSCHLAGGRYQEAPRPFCRASVTFERLRSGTEELRCRKRRRRSKCQAAGVQVQCDADKHIPFQVFFSLFLWHTSKDPDTIHRQLAAVQSMCGISWRSEWQLSPKA